MRFHERYRCCHDEKTPVVWKPIVAIGIAIAAMFGFHAVSTISFVVVVATMLAALWWVAKRDRFPRVLNRLSLGALVIAVVARVIQGHDGSWWLGNCGGSRSVGWPEDVASGSLPQS
jgi:hypothetical protein